MLVSVGVTVFVSVGVSVSEGVSGSLVGYVGKSAFQIVVPEITVDDRVNGVVVSGVDSTGGKHVGKEVSVYGGQ